MSAPIVLNVNDNRVARYTVTRMLSAAGFRVTEAADGASAIAAAEAEPDIAVVVLDVRLPDVDGFEVCRRLKANARTAGMKVLHTSATLLHAENRVTGLEAGADAYLTQPFEAEEIIATVKALTRLRDTERELRAKAEMLAEADRRKDEFLAMLAHELRNPLAVVASSLPLLDRHAPRDDAEARTREMLARQTEILRRLVEDLLDVSRVTHGRIALRFGSVDIVALVHAAAAAVREREPDRPVEVDGDGGPLVHGDPARLEQVLANLLDNARKYSEHGSPIRVEVRPSGDDVVVSVRDQGFGISADHLPHVFELFTQSHHTLARSSGGLGIGLTLVKRIVELHNGRVEARSDGAGRGSEFRVTLPRATDTAAPSRAEDADGAPTVGPCRVLLVEDNADVRESMEALLEMWGHEVHSASDGHQGLARALSTPPDVAFIDVGLPGLDGYEVARLIRADTRGRTLPLVALTGYGSPENRQQALAAGFDLHLVKPIETDEIARVLTAVARGSLRRSA